MSMIEVAILVLLIFGVGIIGFYYYKAYENKNKLEQNPTTKGMNGLGGSTVELSCPAGQVISFDKINTTSTRGALVCLGDSKCDAFFQPNKGQLSNFFNQTNTIDVFSASSPFTDIKECEGKETCSFTVPTADDDRLPLQSSTPGYCLGKCNGQLAFIGTYDCKAA